MGLDLPRPYSTPNMLYAEQKFPHDSSVIPSSAYVLDESARPPTLSIQHPTSCQFAPSAGLSVGPFSVGTTGVVVEEFVIVSFNTLN